jgi:hypothetical protein
MANVSAAHAELTKAKDAVRWLLDHPNGSVDFHGIAYWAGRVETLRREIKASL